MPDLKASAETAASALTGADGFAGVQGGFDVYMTLAQVLAFVKANGAPVVIDANADHPVVASNAGVYLRMTNAAANTVTFQPDATVPLSATFEITVRCTSAGGTTLTPGSGVTLNPPAGGSLVLANGATARVKRISADVFDVY